MIRDSELILSNNIYGCRNDSACRPNEENKGRTCCSFCLFTGMSVCALYTSVCNLLDVTAAVQCMNAANKYSVCIMFCIAFTVFKLLSENQWRQLTRCLLQLLPWWSWFGGGWRCSSAPALSAGQVCGNPPWRQNVEFPQHQKKWTNYSPVMSLCVFYVFMWEWGLPENSTCVCEREAQRERETEWKRSEIYPVSHADT